VDPDHDRTGPPSGTDASDVADESVPDARRGDLGGFIREQRRLTHLSLRKLAEAANVSNPYLSQIERGLRKPSAEILQQIARALSISSESLYIRAGFLDDRDEPVDVIGEIRRDTTLSADQRQALIRIYRSFRAEAGAPVLEPDPTDQEFPDDAER
jgi:transcriptional regulator with XRE-family HTH domain